MTPSDSMIRSMLHKASAQRVHDALTAGGYEITRSRLDTIRSQMISAGAQQHERPAPAFGQTILDPASGAERSSRELLKRQLVTGQHWLVCPARYADACRSVGLF